MRAHALSVLVSNYADWRLPYLQISNFHTHGSHAIDASDFINALSAYTRGNFSFYYGPASNSSSSRATVNQNVMIDCARTTVTAAHHAADFSRALVRMPAWQIVIMCSSTRPKSVYWADTT